MTDEKPVFKPVYRRVMTLTTPFVKSWGRQEVVGLENLPTSGPTVVMGNHDSYWDPVVVGVAARKRRMIQALAKNTLWKNKGLAWVMDGMGQIPIQRGKGDVGALDLAIDALKNGACIGVFPEGTISRGAFLRSRSGAGRLAESVPGTEVVLVATSGEVDLVRFPKRPRIRVEFFKPAGGPMREDESAADFVLRCMEEVRAKVPFQMPGRKKTARKYAERIAQGLPPKEKKKAS